MLGNTHYQRFYRLVEKGYSTEQAIRESKIAPYGSFVNKTLRENFCNLPLAVEKKIRARNKRTNESLAESIVWAKRKGLC
jgi:hypothetical protein